MATPQDKTQGADDPTAEIDEAVVSETHEAESDDVETASDAATADDAELIDVSELQDRAARADELMAQLQRTTADFKNLQRRSVREKDMARRLAIRDLVAAFLPSFDSLERALASAAETEESSGLIEGVRLVSDELFRVLGDRGIERVAPKEGAVDPNVHEAVVRQPTPGVPENHIVTVLETGYVLGDLVIRPARVVVSAGEPQTTSDSASEATGEETSPEDDTPAHEA